jgi:FlaA1/EpsC-like NDP-sugar epimerase
VEINPLQGIFNNLEGTRILAEAAQRHAIKKFLLISSDKAVRPTNVMGATKRCCELLIQTLQNASGNQTGFCAVRFGNVLGSSGSVVPKFLSQIQTGGPVTVTHPDITRYFMLTSEAVGLVLQSLAMSEGGEVFVLDMGEPVRVADMARQLIQLAGKTPGKDIELVFTGLRPGEKLYEELILEGSEEQTQHENIFVMRPRPMRLDHVRQILEKLLSTTHSGGEKAAVLLVMEIAADPAGWGHA